MQFVLTEFGENSEVNDSSDFTAFQGFFLAGGENPWRVNREDIIPKHFHFQKSSRFCFFNYPHHIGNRSFR